jgi:hypothetical protein
MAKKDEYNTTLGDAFKKAFEMGADSSKPVKPAPAKNTAPPPPQSKPAQPPPALPATLAKTPSVEARGPQPRPVAKADHFSKLFYNPSTRSLDDIRKDFYNQSASFSKKKGILEGVSSLYYSMYKVNAREPAAVLKLRDTEELKKEFEQYFVDIKNGRTPIHAGVKPVIKAQSAMGADDAPKTVQVSRKQFSTKTQFCNDAIARREVHVVIGLDFGTSCTKVVIGTPYEQERAFLVPFSGFGHTSNLHLLPTHLASERNYYFLPRTSEKGQYSDLKLKLIKTVASPDDERHYEHAVAYLALVFRFARTWFIDTYKSVFGECKLTWHANVGVPSATYENDDLTELYRKAVLTAWMVSTQEGDINKKMVSEVTVSLHNGTAGLEQTIEIGAFPEVAAEVAGYARSEHRREGLHLLVDIGAGTMDVCGFLLNRSEGADQYPLLSSNVKLYGALQLDLARKNAVISAISKQHGSLMQDGISPICNDLESYVPDCRGIKTQIIDAQQVFAKGCKTQVRSVLMHLRKNMDPYAAAWKTGLPVFLCGGGSAVPMYEEIIDDLSTWLKENTKATGGAKRVSLQKPERLEGRINDADFHRFAVAWGLSWPSWDIGEVITKLEPVVAPNQTTSNNWWSRPLDYSIDAW